MGLFGGLIKDSPATFVINGVRAQKGRMAKRRAKRSYSSTSTEPEYEQRHVTARKTAYYLFAGAGLFVIGGNLLGALLVVGAGIGFLTLARYFEKRLDNLFESGYTEE